MDKCLFCSKEVKVVEGRRPRQFCNGNCRNKYYYKIKSEAAVPRKIGRPKKTQAVAEKEVSEATEAIMAEVTKKSASVFIPKTLVELKALCPPHLIGLDRSEWISENRQKYGV